MDGAATTMVVVVGDMTDGSPPKLATVMNGVASMMRAHFEVSAATQHSGGKGDQREAGLRTHFLKDYLLPGTVEATGPGEALSSSGAVSGECDVMIVDPATPPLWGTDEHRVVPIECLHGVIEVKSRLTAAELEGAWRVIRKAKSLSKDAYRPTVGPVRYRKAYGKRWSHMPVSGFVFAYEGATLSTLGDTLSELAAEEPDPALRLDGVFIMDRGMLVWVDAETSRINPAPTVDGSFGSIEASPGQVLMAFTSMLYEHFADAWMPSPVDIRQYIRNESWGTTRALWKYSEDESVGDGGNPADT